MFIEITTLVHIFQMLMGEFDYDEIKEKNRTMSAFFFYGHTAPSQCTITVPSTFTVLALFFS